MQEPAFARLPTSVGAHASLGFASLRGRFAALLAGAHASLGFASLRGRFAALQASRRPTLESAS